MSKDIIIFSERLEEVAKKEFGDKATPEFLNLIRGAITAHEHAFAQYEISKEKYMEWISQAWDAGQRQRKIYDMEIEGSIQNEMGVLLNFASYLSLFGKKEGYINQKR